MNIGQIGISFTAHRYMRLKLHNNVKRWKVVQEKKKMNVTLH